MSAQRHVEDAAALGRMVDQNELRDSARPLVFLPRREVERRVGLSKSSIYRGVAAGTFPRPVHDLQGGMVWWVEHEVEDWQRARIRARDADSAEHAPGNG